MEAGAEVTATGACAAAWQPLQMYGCQAPLEAETWCPTPTPFPL